VDEEDDLEVTFVSASPGQPTEQVGSKIELIYEDEAELDEITSPVARILVSAMGQSDPGKVRSNNEDSLLVYPERELFVIADGMGGYAGGEVASALAVQVLKDAFERNVFHGNTESETTVPRRGREMACAIQMANQAILARAKEDRSLKDMGTTVVAARFSPNKQRVYIGHVGDSRCYRLRGAFLRQLTTDHTMDQLGFKGPQGHHLYQAVGIKPRIVIDLVVDRPRTDDVYLLCSDGLSKMASDDEVRAILGRNTAPHAIVEALVDLANQGGGKDNVTVIVVKVVEKSALS
jgi:protein phosphatase